MRSMLPILPSMTFFALAVGTLAAQKGLDLAEFVLMQGFVFAGLAQLVALGGWQDAWTLTSLAGVMAVTLTINSRMILMGASIRPWLNDEPFWRNALSLFFLTDANYITAMRYQEEGGRDAGHVLGSGLLLWVVWMIVGLAGYWAGSLVANPRAYGLDLLHAGVLRGDDRPALAGQSPQCGLDTGRHRRIRVSCAAAGVFLHRRRRGCRNACRGLHR